MRPFCARGRSLRVVRTEASRSIFREYCARLPTGGSSLSDPDNPGGQVISGQPLKNGSGAVAEATEVKQPNDRAPAPAAKTPRAAGRAPISDLETVSYYFNAACERIGLADDVQEVLRTSYRETSVQIPVTLADGR